MLLKLLSPKRNFILAGNGQFLLFVLQMKELDRLAECNISTQEKDKQLEKQWCQKEEEAQSKESDGCQIILGFHSTIFFPLLFFQTLLPMQMSMTGLF